MKKKLVTSNKKKSGGSYFTNEEKDVKFIHSGCTALDMVLGGGWALGRMANIVGDRSTGKTLIAIEACANFAHQYPNGKIYYREAEAAFDKGYAASLGMPVDKINFAEDFLTVEDFYEDLNNVLENTPDDEPGLYIVDSLDALSDRAELDRDIDKGSFGAEKAKKLSELFRRLVRGVEKKSVSLIIVSQLRDNIGAMFGEKHKRSGGHAMDFYASQIIWLHHAGMLKKTIKKVERPYGILVKAKCKKNKVSMPFRECGFEIHFGYGIDDLSASADWLYEVGRLDELGMGSKKTDFTKELRKLDNDERDVLANKASKLVRRLWPEIEEQFLPKRKKYGD